MSQEKLWAPWRIGYVQSSDQKPGCFICEYIEDAENDEQNLVFWRTDNSIVMLNRFPYNNGHLLICPRRHIADFDNANDDELLEFNKLIRESQKALTLAIKPHGFNVGINVGRCAGAGLPGHIHIHVVPRWNGDTGFMSVCSDVDVISQSLCELLEQLKQVSRQHGLPEL